MINVLTVEKEIRQILGHDCENDHENAGPHFENLLAEVNSPADLAMVIMMLGVLTGEMIHMLVPQAGMVFPVVHTDHADEEGDNSPAHVAARVVACFANKDYLTAQAIVAAEVADFEHAQRTLGVLLQFAHDL